MKSLAPFLLLALTGCWSNAESITHVTWSDDDQEQAFVHLTYEEREVTDLLGTRTVTQNPAHQIRVRPAHGAGATESITPRRPHAVDGDFYYLSDPGYVLFALDLEGSRRWDQAWLDGTIHEVHRFDVDTGTGPVSPCRSAEVLPSPDGSQIVVAQVEGAMGQGCIGGTYTTTFLDAATLTQTAQYSWTVDGMPTIVWPRNGHPRVWVYQGDAWQVDPASGPSPSTPLDDCWYPRTSSSALSFDGTRIAPGTVSDPVEITEVGADNCWADGI